ncbi:Cna B-type domain-containing protein [Schaalia sp. ZJ405]|uniref:Cna B-type domain-containing protein n=1 Tax=Schaalia sp. ZJ405 TaxID=2709403 RepID=UPI0013EC40D1|nr:Cna B-type domain-containing protein [Schaalia sp. ZJ405]QPK82016.1 Cna B-type domain-containing protein [Schaalia sp. ZJ405]
MSVKRRLLPGLLAITIAFTGLPATAVTPDTDVIPSPPPSTTAESSAVAESSANSETPQSATAEPAGDESNGSGASASRSLGGAPTATEAAPTPVLRSRADGDPAAGADDTSRVTLTVGTLTAENKVIKGETTYLMHKPISDVVDLDISAEDYSLENPYLRIRIPKTNKLTGVKVVPSQAGTTERSSDEQYEYVTSRFSSLAGGTQYTYPYTFAIDGKYAQPGDTFTVDATLYTADGVEIAHDSKTYTARGVGYTAYSLAEKRAGANYNYSIRDTPNGHNNRGSKVTVKDSSVTTIPEGTSVTSNLYLSIAPDNGNRTNEGLVVPKNVKMVVTLPAGARIQFPGPDVTVKDLSEGRQEVTFIKSDPSFDRNFTTHSNGKYATFGEFSRAKENSNSPKRHLKILFTGVPLDTDLPVTIDYYVNAESDGTGGTKVGSRTEFYHFPKNVFTKTGSRLLYKSGTIFQAHNVPLESAYNKEEYYWHNEHIYAGTKDFTDPGLGYYAFFGNENNGSGPTGRDRFQGGKTTSITEVITENTDSRTRFSSFRLAPEPEITPKIIVNDDNRDIIEANEKIVEEGVNKGNTKLYGVRADGTRELIKEHVQLGDDIAITEQTEGEFTQLVLAFENPVLFDNTRLIVRTFSKLTTAEQERLKASPTFDTFTLRENIAVALEGETSTPFKFNGTINISPLRPTVDQNKPEDSAVTYQIDKKGQPTSRFRLTVGPTLPNGLHTTAETTYGPLTEIRNIRTVTLLPEGVEYVASLPDMSSTTVTTVANYHGTGKTAVIVDYGTVPVATYSRTKLTLLATAATTGGPHEIPTYMMWDGNDVASPATNPYTDALDLDEDGDTTETFQVRTSTLTFTPPKEFVLTKQSSIHGATSSKVAGDLGSDLSHRLVAYNGSRSPMNSLTIIDVLPYQGDHAIVETASGYPERGSTFTTGLTGSLEDANTPEVNAKFAFSYQLTPQGADLASVRDGEWVPADHVTDFSHVKSVRAVLKEGQKIPSDTAVTIVIPSRMPTDTSLKDISVTDADKAVNTAAFSTNGSVFTEATSTTVQIQKYHIKGRYFVDINGDSSYTAGTDKPLAGRELHIVNDDGTPAKDPSGKILPAVVTSADGTYDATIYATGTYRLKALKAQTEDFVTTPGTGVSGNNIDATTVSGNEVTTTSVNLVAHNATQVRNVAIRLIPGTVTITKTSKAEDGTAASPLAGAVFRLTDTADKQVTGTNGEVIQDVTTNTQGKATFTNVPLGAYKVVEITAPTGYARSATKHDVTLTRDAVNATLAVENALDRTSVQVTKVWNDANNQDGIRPSEVTITLKADGTSAGKSVKLNAGNHWTATFEGLRAYTPQGTQIAYTVEETTVPDGYTSQVSGTAANGYTVTNTHQVARRSVSVSATFSDNENQDGIRPTSVTVTLLADGVETDKTATLNADNNWSATFNNLEVNNNGTPITYTVRQNAITDYTTTPGGTMTNGLTLRNTHVPAVVDVPVSKVWVDNGNAKNLRPASVTVSLKADGTAVAGKSLTLNAGNQWTASFTGLAKFKAPGQPITYEVVEDAVDHYESVTSGTAATGFTVTNTITGQVSVSATKAWSGILPDHAPQVRLALLADGQVTQQQDVNAGNNWQHTFTGLPQYDGGREIVYTVGEVTDNGLVTTTGTLTAGGHDYTVAVTSQGHAFTVTNTLVNPTITVSGTVVWVDNNNQDGVRPATATVRLISNGTPTGAMIPVDANGDGTFSFTDLPTYDNHGNPITYTVSEEDMTGYTSTVNGKLADGFTVTNTHQHGTRAINVSKVWDDAGNQDAIRPTEVTVKLVADGVDTGKTLTLDAEGKWAGTFTGLDTNKAGKEIHYTVAEDAVEGYTASYSGSMKDGLTVTNTHEVATRDIVVTKVWDDADNQDGIRPDSVTVKLRADGKDTGKTLTLTADGKWSGTFTGLETNKAGKEIQYTVAEDKVANYTAEYGGTMKDGLTVTNTHKVTKRDIKVTKVWEDADNQDAIRPDSVTIKLLANGVDTGKTLTLNAKDAWTGVFTGLDTNKAGKEIQYTVAEDPVKEYTPSYSGSMTAGLTVTNTHKAAKRDIVVSKVWDDADDQDGVRPTEVTVKLVADGVETGKTLTLTAKDTWTGVFTGLDTNTAGKEIQYTVVEDPVKGYDTAVTGSAGDGYTVTNTLIHGNITLTKVSDTGTPLAGAVFELRRHDGHVADTQTTSKDGTLVFTRVAYGKYTVVETHAPKGYRNTTHRLSAQITTHGETVDLGTVVNKKIPTLAHTGTNTLITGTLGASLLILGTLLIQRHRRRRLED